jgi:hypothetical protein
MAGETEVLGENLPLCPPQIPLGQTRTAAVGSQRLTASAMARPMTILLQWLHKTSAMKLTKTFKQQLYIDYNDD